MAKAQELVLNLVEMIESRTLRQGQLMPSERELCERFGSARNTVRRALSILEDERRLVRQPGRRGYVVDASRALLGPSLARSAEAGPADIMELRLIAEPSAAAIAAVRASSADLDAIERAAMQIASSKTIVEREDNDAAFHLAVFRATRNPMLVSLCLSINAVRENDSWIDNKRRILSEERQCEFDAQHLAVVAALRRRDPDAARSAMRSHIDSLRKELLGDFLV